MSLELEERNQDEQSDSSAIKERLQELNRRSEELNQAFIRWIPMRRRTMEQLEELASKLHEHHINVNISTAAGAGMGTVGGILSIAGLIAAPFTFGAGIIVTLVGAGIGSTGGVVMVGAKGAEAILTKMGVKNVQQTIDEDTAACMGLQEQLDEMESFLSDLSGFLRHNELKQDELIRELEGSGFEFLQDLFPNDFTTSTDEKLNLGARFFRAIMSAAPVTTGSIAAAGAFARSAAMAGTRAAQIAGSVISAALLPLDIFFLVKSSLELHRGSTSNAVEKIKNILDTLECPDEKEVEMLVKRFITERFPRQSKG
ncbi:hypothetical protein ACROYT_G036245 [Oculina patagonica]